MDETLPPPTDRIRFRRFGVDDDAAVADMFADPLARRFYPGMDEPGAAQRWIGWNLELYAEHGFGLWVIESVEDGTFLGDCGLTHQSVEGRRLLEIGYHLQARHRGNGYATEAGHAVMEYAFRALGADQTCSIVDPDNTPSIRVAARIHASHRTFVNGRDRRMQLYWTERGRHLRHPGADESRRGGSFRVPRSGGVPGRHETPGG